MLVHQSLDCFVVVVICGCADNGSVRHWVLCGFFRKYMRGVDVLDKGCGGIFNVLSTSSLMSFTFTWCICLQWYCCWCVWLVFVGISVQSSVYICFEFDEVVYDFSWFGLLWVRYKGQSLIEDLFSAVVSLLFLRLTMVSVVLGC